MMQNTQKRTNRNFDAAAELVEEVLDAGADIAEEIAESILNDGGDVAENILEGSDAAESVLENGTEAIGDVLDAADDLPVLAVIGIIVGAVTAVGGIALAVYKFWKRTKKK